MCVSVCVLPNITYFPKGTWKNRVSSASQSSQETGRGLDMACEPPLEDSAGWTVCQSSLDHVHFDAFSLLFPSIPTTLTSSRLNSSDLGKCTSEDS